jgi:hypothetical protein
MSERDEDAVVRRLAKALFKTGGHAPVLALLTELRPGDPLPGGGVWMPVEPTPDMLIAGGIAWAECVDGESYVDNANAAYRAMIRAASEGK